VLEGHSGRLNAVVTSTDGTTIITCSDDNTARVWDGNSYKLIRCVCAPFERLRPLLLMCKCVFTASTNSPEDDAGARICSERQWVNARSALPFAESHTGMLVLLILHHCMRWAIVTVSGSGVPTGYMC
jgi:hypothetical protein